MMNPQTEITITVPLEIAQAYNLATEAERQKMSQKIIFFLQSSISSRQEAIQKLHQTMDDIGQKAISRGLTPEILESILNKFIKNNDKSHVINHHPIAKSTTTNNTRHPHRTAQPTLGNLPGDRQRL